MKIDFRGKTVLVNEGATGIGLHIALAFARRGAACILTHRNADVGEAGVLQQFAAAGTAKPLLARVENAREENLETLLCRLRTRHDCIDVLVQAGSAPVLQLSTPASFEEYSRQQFLGEIENEAWALVEYTRGIKRVFESYPRYIIGLADTSTLEYSAGADFSAASGSAMESLCRYINRHLFDEDVRVNVLRYRNLALDDFANGNVANDVAARLTPQQYRVPPAEVADAAVALCSGLMDSMSGHVLTVDRGTTFFDNLMRLYTEREQYEL